MHAPRRHRAAPAHARLDQPVRVDDRDASAQPQRNVKRWQRGDMALRWTAAGMLEAERQFRRIIGYRDLAKLAVAVEREVGAAALPSPTTRGGAETVTV